MKTGADDYIPKAFSVKHLVIRCNNLVNSRKSLQKRYARETGHPVDLIATTSLDQTLIEQSIKLIENNLDNPMFSIDFLAREMGIGRTKYFHKIKAITGMTPNDFVTDIKLKLACRMLKEGPDLSTSELAFRLGFSSTSYFIKKFKEFSGTTPKLYRQGA